MTINMVTGIKAFYIAMLFCGLMRSACTNPILSSSISNIVILKGFKCMQIKHEYISYNASRDDVSTPILEFPKQGAKSIVEPGILIIAKDPIKMVNGFVEVLCPNWRLGWIEARFIEPWHVQGDPHATCTPHRLSNGYPGY